MRKFLGGMLGTLVVGALALFMLSHFGALSWGGNDSNGETEQMETEKTVTVDENKEIMITIVVTQDKYLIEEQEVTLTQIKEKVTDESAVIKVVLEDNYASAKAWDDIKKSLAEWGVVPVEQ